MAYKEGIPSVNDTKPADAIARDRLSAAVHLLRWRRSIRYAVRGAHQHNWRVFRGGGSHLRGQWSKDPGANTFAIAMIAIFIPLVPWSYVFEHYVRKSGDRWWGRAPVSPDEALSKR